MRLVPPNWVSNGLIPISVPHLSRQPSSPGGRKIVYAPTDPGRHDLAALQIACLLMTRRSRRPYGYGAVKDNYTLSLGSAVGVDGYQLDNSIGDPTLFNNLEIAVWRSE